MKNLLRNSILLLLVFTVFGCKYYDKKGFHKEGVTTCDPSDIAIDFFDKTSLFKMKIFFYKEYYSGLLVVKKIDETHRQVVLLTEIGMKLLDMTITKEDYVVNHVIPPLDRNILLKGLWDDFSDIFITTEYEQETIKKYWSKDEQKLFKVKEDEKQYLLIDKDNHRVQLNDIGMLGSISKVISFEYVGEEIEKVVIQSNQYKLKVQLEKKKLNNAK